MQLFRVGTDDQYCIPVLRSEEHTSAQFWQMNHVSLVATWRVEHLIWECQRRRSRRPQVTVWFTDSRVCIASDFVDALITNRAGLELLPLRIDGEEWFVTNVLATLSGTDLATSDYRVLPPQELQTRSFNWVNLVHPLPLPVEFFRLAEGVPTQVFVTEPFVERYKALGLHGLRFELVGHVIDSPEQAVPMPPRLTPPEPKTSPKPRAAKLSFKPLPKAWVKEMRQCEAAVRERIGLAAGAGEEEVLAAVRSELQRLRSLPAPQHDDAGSESLLGLSALYGDLVCARAGWHWTLLCQSRGPQWIALRSPDERHALTVTTFIQRQLQAPEDTLLLQINMIAAAQLPEAPPGKIVPLC